MTELSGIAEERSSQVYTSGAETSCESRSGAGPIRGTDVSLALSESIASSVAGPPSTPGPFGRLRRSLVRAAMRGSTDPAASRTGSVASAMTAASELSSATSRASRFSNALGALRGVVSKALGGGHGGTRAHIKPTRVSIGNISLMVRPRTSSVVAQRHISEEEDDADDEGSYGVPHRFSRRTSSALSSAHGEVGFDVEELNRALHVDDFRPAPPPMPPPLRMRSRSRSLLQIAAPLHTDTGEDDYGATPPPPEPPPPPAPPPLEPEPPPAQLRPLNFRGPGPSQRPDDRTLSFRNKQLNERMTRARRQRAAAMAFTKAGATVRQAPAGVEISMRAAATVRQEGATTAALAALPEAAPATTPAKPKRGGSSVTQSTPEMLKARRRSEALGITVPTCGTTCDLDGGPPPVILPPSGGSFPAVLVADDEKKQTTRERTPQRPAFTEPSEPDVDSPPQRLSSAERKSLARHSLAVARPPSDLFASPAPTYSEPMTLRSASRKEKAGGESREASRTREERMEALRSHPAGSKGPRQQQRQAAAVRARHWRWQPAAAATLGVAASPLRRS